MSSTYAPAESVETLAQSLIGTYHPELATARIGYGFIERVPKKGGRELSGKAVKVSGRWMYLTELDFYIEVAAPKWNEMNEEERTALVDHLLESCTGEEQEEGDMKWVVREPDVQEFTNILQRHGAWTESLRGFVRVAHEIDVPEIIREETGTEVEETEEQELDLNEID